MGLRKYLKKMGMVESIRGKLVFYFLAILIVPIFVFTAVEYHRENALIRERVKKQLSDIADSRMAVIDGWVEEKSAGASMLAGNLLIKNHFTALLPYAKNPALLKKQPDYVELLDPLNRLIRSYGYYEATLCDKDGIVVISTTEDMVGKSVKGVEYFEGGLHTADGKVYIQDIFYTGKTNQPVMAFSYPVKSFIPDGNPRFGTIGVAVLKVDLSRTFYALALSWTGTGETGETLLARKEGNDVVFLSKLRHMKDAPLGFRLSVDKRRPLPAYLAASGLNGIIETRDYRGVDVIAAYRYMPRIRWGLVAKVDTAEALEPLREMGKTAMWTLLLSVFSITILMYVVSRTIVAPIGLLAENTRKIASGDFTVKLPEFGKDEIGELARSFNGMADALRISSREVEKRGQALEKVNAELTEFTGSLEDIVRSRTLELEALNRSQAVIMKNLDERSAALEKSQVELKRFTSELEESRNRVKENLEIVERANVELRRMDRMKDHFLGMISHELRTPLSLIMGYSSNMLSDRALMLDPKVEEEVEGIYKGADRLRGIITEMLDISTIDAKGMKLAFRPVDLGRMVKEVVYELDVFVRERKQTVEVGDFSVVPPLMLDRSRMYQVLVNIIGNAIKFTPDGGTIWITPSVQEVSPDMTLGKVMDYSRQVEIVVKDSGIGLDKDELGRIFEKFYEVGEIEKHTTSKYQFLGRGVGLGLPIARGIVEAHGGLLWAESEGYDQARCPGSSFHIVLPVRVAEEEPVEPLPAYVEAVSGLETRSGVTAMKADEPGRAPTGRHKVLVIEDDHDVLNLTMYILKKKYDVYKALDGAEGIKLARMLKPDLIMLDVYMDGMNGYEVCQILKSDPDTRDITLAMFTAGVQRWEVEKGYSSGADGYITKPFKPDELLAKVEGLISGRLETANS